MLFMSGVSCSNADIQMSGLVRILKPDQFWHIFDNFLSGTLGQKFRKKTDPDTILTVKCQDSNKMSAFE